MSGLDQIKADVFQWKSSTLYYRSWGNADSKKLMLAFHGYGLDGASFHSISKELLEEYRWVSIDLPYQGRTRWRETEPLNGQDLGTFILSFLAHLKHEGKVNLIAYSIGGNYALGLAVKAPELVEKLILIAADGLKFKFPFWFITHTWIGRGFFKGFVMFPQPIFYIISAGRWMKLYPPRVLNFFYESIATKNKRAALMLRWISVSRILPPHREICKVINKNQLPVYLLFGKRDLVIPFENAVRFEKNLNNAHLTLLDQGHQLMHSQNALALKELIDL